MYTFAERDVAISRLPQPARTAHDRSVRRRELLKAAMAAPLVAACDRAARDRRPRAMPALFLAHGSPLLLDDEVWVRELRTWAQRIPRPRAILVLSAHWELAPLTLGATRTVPLVYDFEGFPDRYYRVTYAAPGAPDLADRVTALVAPLTSQVYDQPTRGLDHGAYVPLVAMYPDASVPVLQASLPSLEPADLFALGRALAPLRDEGVLIIGSGFLSHNLWAAHFETPRDVLVDRWAADFDAWCADALARRDVDALLDYKHRAPAIERALPTHEHFAPVLAALGASIDRADPVAFPITGWIGGNLTRRSIQFG
jgi:4,5-DOPA dioxygenase extradiol